MQFLSLMHNTTRNRIMYHFWLSIIFLAFLIVAIKTKNSNILQVHIGNDLDSKRGRQDNMCQFLTVHCIVAHTEHKLKISSCNQLIPVAPNHSDIALFLSDKVISAMATYSLSLLQEIRKTTFNNFSISHLDNNIRSKIISLGIHKQHIPRLY